MRGTSTHTQALAAHYSVDNGMKGSTKAMPTMNKIIQWVEKWLLNNSGRLEHVEVKSKRDKKNKVGYSPIVPVLEAFRQGGGINGGHLGIDDRQMCRLLICLSLNSHGTFTCRSPQSFHFPVIECSMSMMVQIITTTRFKDAGKKIYLEINGYNQSWAYKDFTVYCYPLNHKESFFYGSSRSRPNVKANMLIIKPAAHSGLFGTGFQKVVVVKQGLGLLIVFANITMPTFEMAWTQKRVSWSACFDLFRKLLYFIKEERVKTQILSFKWNCDADH
nr:vacuolar protein sorting-associated protein 2 homolog 3 [Tanacetum cinerariifolium]